ncbi:MAG: hypothetical protein ABIL37_04695 [candidate division WOR-3 bacterium]
MFWLINMMIIDKSEIRIAEGYYTMTIRGKSESIYVANVIKGNVNKNVCEIPLLNLKFGVEGIIQECIYKPTNNLNEFKVVIKYRK